MNPPRAKPQPSPAVHLLVGEEDLLVEQALAELLDAVIPAADRALNLDVVRADEAPIDDIITRVDTLPFFGAHRVVVVRDADRWNAADQERLAAYLDHGPPPSVLILVAGALDRRRKLFSAVKRAGSVREFPRLKTYQLASWVSGRAKQQDRAIDRDAADALVALVGSGLRQLALELDKVVAFAGDRPRVTRADVEAAASRRAETTIFHLVDAVGERRTERALRHLVDILAEEAPPYVLFMIARQFRLLLRARSLQAQRREGAALQRALGVPPFLVERVLAQARNFPLEVFPAIFARLQDADRAVKSTGHPDLALETLVVELCEEKITIAQSSA
ncbi:MAG TPA: DNA polymerase III subunit delta [bacterium]|nr:DNA polymerase III subunit delta [bacterium]